MPDFSWSAVVFMVVFCAIMIAGSWGMSVSRKKKRKT